MIGNIGLNGIQSNDELTSGLDEIEDCSEEDEEEEEEDEEDDNEDNGDQWQPNGGCPVKCIVIFLCVKLFIFHHGIVLKD